MFFPYLRRQVFSHVWLARSLLLLAILTTGVVFWLFLRRPVSVVGGWLWSFSHTSLPQHSGRTNFLILGVAGGDHEGPDLTDTMIFFSVDESKKDALALSLPRDLWVPSLRAKLNTAYHYGSEKAATQGGLLLAKSAISEVIGQPVDFAFIFDFSLFGRVIDTLGGVNVNVERSFDDYFYPVDGKGNDTCGLSPAASATAAASITDDASAAAAFPCRYEHISFATGLQHMDGTMALKYVRSRHAVGEEGTDFDRSRRQENIIAAIKNRLLSREVASHPRILLNLYNLVSSSLVTDFPADKYPAALRMALSVKNGTQRSFSLKEPDQLENPPISARYDYQWVLIPKQNKQQLLNDYVSSLLQ